VDKAALVIENSANDPVSRLGEWLTDAGLALDVVRAYDGQPLPEDVDGHSALIVMGGHMSAYNASEPWISPVKSLLRAAVGGGVPVLGVCLGGQLLADALGGFVEPSPNGPERGASLVAKRDAALSDPLFGPLPMIPDVIQWHYDAITELPPGATLLAASPRCENQAFRVGDRAWGTQFHIEATSETVRGWASRDGADDLEQLVAGAESVQADIERVWRPVAARFVDVVRSRR